MVEDDVDRLPLHGVLVHELVEAFDDLRLQPADLLGVTGALEEVVVRHDVGVLPEQQVILRLVLFDAWLHLAKGFLLVYAFSLPLVLEAVELATQGLDRQVVTVDLVVLLAEDVAELVALGAGLLELAKELVNIAGNALLGG